MQQMHRSVGKQDVTTTRTNIARKFEQVHVIINYSSEVLSFDAGSVDIHFHSLNGLLCYV